MGKYAKYNAENVLKNVEACIAELEELNSSMRTTKYDYNRYKHTWVTSKKDYSLSMRFSFRIRSVCDKLSIFDWWNDNLSMSQLKQMRSFLKTAIKLGFNGYVCFKVGASGCAHGMWAHKDESTNGYSPDCDNLFHSFRSGDNYWSGKINGTWLATDDKYKYTIDEIKDILKGGE